MEQTDGGARVVGGDRRATIVALALIAASLALRIAFAALTPPLRVETYYWTWSQELAWGYTDHPPMVALVIDTFSPLLDHSVLGLRLGSLILATLGAFLFWRLCLRLVSPRAALGALGVLVFAPFWFPFGVVITPDSPLLFFWTLSILLFHTAWSRDNYGSWIGAGAATGLAILSKYNGFLLPGVFFAFLCLNERGRRQLRGLRPLLGFLVTAAIVAPNLYWNAKHGGSTVKTPLREGVELARSLQHVGLFLLLPFGLLTPPVVWAWIRQTAAGLRTGRFRNDATFQLSLCASWLPLAAFGPVSVLTLVHFHWPATCMILALPLAFENLGRRGPGPSHPGPGPSGSEFFGPSLPGPSPGFLRWTLGSYAGLLAVAVLGAGIALAAARPDPDAPRQEGLALIATELTGWPELSVRLEQEVSMREVSMRGGSTGQVSTGEGEAPFFVASFSFHFASVLDWTLRHRFPVYALDASHRRQYATWYSESDFYGRDALCVDAAPLAKREEDLLRKVFASVERLEPIRVVVRGAELPRFELFWCRGYRGSPPRE